MPVTGAKPEVREDVVKFQARTMLLNLAEEIANARKLISKETLEKIKQASQIRIWLKTLDSSEFLTREEKFRIIYALVDIANLNDFPLAPILSLRTKPDILVGAGGGDTIVNNTFEGGTTFLNSDVDAPSEVVDTFAISLSNGCMWQFTIINGAGTALRKGTISAGWLSDGSAIESGSEFNITEIGDTSAVTFSVDINAGNVRLIANTTTNDWSVRGKRYID